MWGWLNPERRRRSNSAGMPFGWAAGSGFGSERNEGRGLHASPPPPSPSSSSPHCPRKTQWEGGRETDWRRHRDFRGTTEKGEFDDT